MPASVEAPSKTMAIGLSASAMAIQVELFPAFAGPVIAAWTRHGNAPQITAHTAQPNSSGAELFDCQFGTERSSNSASVCASPAESRKG